MVVRIVEQEKAQELEIPIEDGFELYKQLASMRRIFAEELPGYDIPLSLCVNRLRLTSQ